MLTLQECIDYCDLTEDEIIAIERGVGVTAIEACAVAECESATPEGCRKILRYMQEHLEHVEATNTAPQRSDEVHRAIDHFVAHHHFI